MHAVASEPKFAKPPAEQRAAGWLWLIKKAMNRIRTASKDFGDLVADVMKKFNSSAEEQTHWSTKTPNPKQQSYSTMTTQSWYHHISRQLKCVVVRCWVWFCVVCVGGGGGGGDVGGVGGVGGVCGLGGLGGIGWYWVVLGGIGWYWVVLGGFGGLGWFGVVLVVRLCGCAVVWLWWWCCCRVVVVLLSCCCRVFVWCVVVVGVVVC